MRYEKLFQTALDPLSIETGAQVGGYMLIHELGRGGSGVVWLAAQSHLGREVALKVLQDASPATNWGGSTRSQARFHREVEVASLLDHPNIAHVYDSGFTDGIPYLVMEYIDGQSLHDYVQKAALTEQQIIELVKTIAEGVQHAHQRGVIHRDLKPSNILVNAEGRPVIVDFGLAKALDSRDIGAAGAEVSLDGELVGTPAYMAPEQARGESATLDTRVDVYALGVILYRLLTGRLPHDVEGTSIEVLRRISETEIVRPSLVKASLKGDLEALLVKALAKDPEERYASSGELADDLGRYLTHQPLQARSANSFYYLSKHLKRNWANWAAVVLGLMVVGAAITRYVHDIKTFAHTEKELRSTLAIDASSAEFRNAEVEDEVDSTFTTLATSLEQNPNNLPAATLAGMLLTQTTSLLPLSALPPHASSTSLQFQFAESAPVYASHNSLTATIYSENSPQPVSPRLAHDSSITHLELAASGETLVTMQENGQLSAWSQHDHWQTPTFTQSETAHRLRISPNGRWVSWITMDDEAFLWDWQSEDPSRLTPTEAQVLQWKEILGRRGTELLFDPKNRYLLIKKGAHSSTLWNLQTRSLCALTRDEAHGSNPPAPLYYRFSPDGQRMVAFQPGMPLLFHYQLQNRASDTLQIIPPTSLSNNQGFSAGAFLPDSNTLLVTGSEQVARADLISGTLVEISPKGLYWPGTIAISGDGRMLAITGTKDSACLLDTQTGETKMSIDHSWGVQKLALNDSGTRLALVDGRGKLSIWDLKAKRMLGVIDAKLREMAKGQSLRFSLTGNHIVATTSDGDTRAYRILEPSITPKTLSGDEPILSFVLSPDTSKLITATADKARLWDTSTGKLLVGPLAHAGPGADPPFQIDFRFRKEAAFEPSGEAFYLRKTDKQPQRYLLDGTPSGPGVQLRQSHGTLQVTPADPPIISSTTVRGITVWEPDTGNIRWDAYPKGYLVRASLSSGGNYILTGSVVREVTIWDFASGQQIHQMVPHHSWLSDVAWSPDESLLATAADNPKVKLFSTESWKELATFGHQDKVTRVAFHPNKPILLSAAKDGTATLWDVESFSSFGHSMEHDSPVLFASFSRNGEQFVTGCQDGTVHLWDTQSQRRLCQPIRHPGAVTKVEFTADFSHLVTLCVDGKVRMWPIFIAGEPAPTWFPKLLRGLSGSSQGLDSWSLTPAESKQGRYSSLIQQVMQKASTP